MGGKERILGLSAAAGLLAISTVAMAEPQIGNVVQRQYNGATGTRTAAGSIDSLIFTHDVFAGEKVVTPAQGSTVMRFRDQTQLQIGANSSVVLDRFVYDPNTQADSGSISFAKGIFRYVGGQAKDAGGVQLTTPTTTLTIRGTKFVVHIDDDGTTTVSVLEGEVDVKPCGGGAVTKANAGQAFQVTRSCSTLAVAPESMPSDPATDGDYGVTESLGKDVTAGGDGAGTAPGPKAPSGGGGGFGKGGGSGGPPG